MVAELIKSGEVILAESTPEDMHQIHMGIGVSSEAGELLDALKKHWVYRRELDLENVEEELGDIEFFLEGLRVSVGLTREQCLEANERKLRKRYPKKRFSNEDAQERKDKL